MNEWLDELADRLGEARIEGEELRAILKLSREVAHGVERRFAPLSSFLIGMAVGRRSAEGEPRARAFDEATGIVRDLLPKRPPRSTP